MLKWISKNQGMVVGFVLVIALMLWTYGCESTVTSPITGLIVTRPQLHVEIKVQSAKLEAELDSLKEQALLQYAQLDKEDEIRNKIFDFAAITAEHNTFNPTGIITLAGTLLGLGFGVDNRIKDKVIKNRPQPVTPTA